MHTPAVISKKKLTSNASPLENPPNRNRSRFSGRALVAALLAFALYPSFTAAQNIGMVADDGTNTVIVFDGDADTVLGTVSLPSGGAVGDCAVTADQALGFVTDFASRVWVIDLTTSPPSLAAGTNPIPISNPGEDLIISPNGQFLIVCDGSAVAPISVVDISSRTEVSTFAPGSNCTSVDICPDGSVIVTEVFPGRIHRLILDAFGNLTHSGETLNLSSDPFNVYCVPNGKSGVVITAGLAVSFTIPGLTQVDARSLSGHGVSGVFNL
ncbi:MAG: hypothetical protein IIB00_00395, partial [candidate division Zixibacteria bacterium]|nr:hypothetical protein [candidate division Zixibacteria bacterium]